jgi:DNA repair protein RadC
MHNKPTVTDALKWSVTALEVLSKAADIIGKKLNRHSVFTSPQTTKDYLTYKLAPYEREVFCVLLLDSQHRLIEYRELFYGTIDATAVYPREVVKLVLEHNAAAVIFAHNHPSGVAEPSMADKNITQKLISALALIDVRVLDHIVVGETQVSFAERGLI